MAATARREYFVMEKWSNGAIQQVSMKAFADSSLTLFIQWNSVFVLRECTSVFRHVSSNVHRGVKFSITKQ